MDAGIDPDQACGLVAQLAQRVDLGADLIEMRGDGPEKALARLGRGHAARCVRQQAQAPALFQATDRVTDRRSRHAQNGNGLGETARLRHNDEGPQVAELVPRHS